MINTSMKKVVIYPGRFQPMLSHHAEVYKQLKSQFPDADVFVGTSDKVEAPKSPFNFKEKQLIAAAHGVPADHVLMAGRPYHKDDYAKYFDENNTIIIFAVGEKDLDRFPFGNVDAKTGLDMTVKGDLRPKYYQKINTLEADPRPMSERGYITLAPTIMTGDEVASASAFRQALIDAPDETAAKQVFQKQFGNYDDKIFKLIYSKVTGATMSEQLNIMRKLAGLPVQEAAPVAFNASADAKTAKFLPTNASSAKMSIANRFPKGVDVNDPKVKQEQFIQALLRSPEALISEFSERLDPKDDNSLAVGQKLSDIMQLMNQKDIGVAGLPKDLKQFVLDLTVNAVKNMELKAGDDSPAYKDDDEDDFKRESLDLSDIRNEYGVKEAKDEDEDEDDDSWIPSEDEFDQEIKHGYKGRKVEAKDEDEDDDSWIPSEDEFDQEIKHGYKGRKVESEKIDELSPATKAAYVGKASAEIGKHWDRSHLDADSARKYYNRKNTMRRISNEPDDMDDDSWIPSEDDFEKEIQGGYKGRNVRESAEDVLMKVATGELDAYDVMSNPKTAEEKVASSKIQSMYDDVSIDYHLHPDDDFEKILDIVVDQLAKDLGVDEGMGDNIDPVEGGPEHSMTDKPKATKPKFGYDVSEAKKKKVNPYAVGMAQAMKSRGDQPPLKKSTIKKGHEIARAVAANEAVESTADNAVSAAIAELRKLAGI